MATCQNGWPAHPTRDGIVALEAHGVSFPGGVAAGDVATVMQYAADQYHLRVEPLVAGWCWGWAYRNVRGSDDLSNHAGGYALDFDAPRHPLAKRGTLTAKQSAAMDAIRDEIGRDVWRWGKDYSGRVDEMHGEIIGTPEQCKAAANRIRLRGGAPPAPTGIPQVSPMGRPTLRRGSKGDAVAFVQRWLGVKPADGAFGPITEAAVIRYQRRQGLTPDGVVGPATWGAMGR